MNRILQLKNGIRMAYTYDSNVRSVCWGVFVGAGSSDEDVATNGISHLLEHMCFKGTARRTPFDIVRETDELGADINAYTGKEMTAYYVHCLDESIEQCCDILADIVLHSTFDPAELAKEKQVVLEEIDMSEDTPDDLVSDVAAQAFWGQDPLARPILGSKDNVMRFSQQHLVDYRSRHYVASNVVLSVVGHISLEEAVRLGERYFDFPRGEVCKSDYPLRHDPIQVTRTKDVEQSHIILSYAGYPAYSEQRAAIAVFDAIFGGGMSSILFQRVREQRGLAYSVYSYPSYYRGRGAYGIYMGTNPAKMDEALSTVTDIVAELQQKGISPEELARGRQQAKSAYVLGLESNMARMRVQARYLLNRNIPFDENDEIAALDRVGVQDVQSVIHTLFAAPPSIGLVAKQAHDYTEYFYGK